MKLHTGGKMFWSPLLNSGHRDVDYHVLMRVVGQNRWRGWLQNYFFNKAEKQFAPQRGKEEEKGNKGEPMEAVPIYWDSDGGGDPREQEQVSVCGCADSKMGHNTWVFDSGHLTERWFRLAVHQDASFSPFLLHEEQKPQKKWTSKRKMFCKAKTVCEKWFKTLLILYSKKSPTASSSL